MPIALQGLKVLAVDDEPILLMTLEDILDDLGCLTVATALNLQDALSVATAADFEVAILDVTLGQDQIEPVVALIAGRDLPILFATGLESREMCARFGNDCKFVQKPFTLETLSAALLAAVPDKV
jgi:DNA-binding NtrC family response regulator